MEEYVTQVCGLLEKGCGRKDVVLLKERFLSLSFVYERLHERVFHQNRWVFDDGAMSYAYIYFVDLERDEVESVTIQFDGQSFDVRTSYERTSDFDFHEILCMKYL
jgi:hypothetical protein